MLTHTKETTFVDLLQERGTTLLDRCAFVFLEDGEIEGDRLTYGQLDQYARSLAVWLQQRGVSRGQAILLYPSGLEFIVAFCGCLYAEITPVPVNPPRGERSISRLQAIVAASEAEVILTTTELKTKFSQWVDRVPELAALTWLASDEIEAESRLDLATRWRAPTIHADTLAFLQYTSGTTGQPKGVMVSHQNLLANQRSIARKFQHDRHSVIVGWLPLYHDMGLIGKVLQPLYLGTHCIFMSPTAFTINPYRWLWAISHYRAVTSGGPNFAYELCVQKITPEERESLDLGCWRIAFNGAEPVRGETIEKFSRTFADCGFRRAAFYPCYGLAEATLFVTGGDISQPPALARVDRTALEQQKVVNVDGQPLDRSPQQTLVGCGSTDCNHQIIIVDPNERTLCPPDRVGEIWIAGESVARGYWNHPIETENTFNAYLVTGEGPFLRTGDLGFLQEGQLFIAGRLKDVIIVRGRNYYPQDIEESVTNVHPSLRPNSGAAFVVDSDSHERLVIVQEVERSYLRTLNIQGVTGDIRQRIAGEYGLQVHDVVLIKPASLPKTSSGKIQRSTCKLQYLEGQLNLIAPDITGARQVSSVQGKVSFDSAQDTKYSAQDTNPRLGTRILGSGHES